MLKILYRPDHKLYLLCILCTILTMITSAINLIHILRRSSGNDRSTDPTTRTTLTSTNRSIQFENLTNIVAQKVDHFEETYRTFSHSFLHDYLGFAANRSVAVNYCPSIPPDLQGPLKVKKVPTNFSLLTNSSYHPNVQLGGHFSPRTCRARHKVAVIVPYRNRWEILTHFLYHTHQILQRQQLDYRIYVCEQAYETTFNKGIVMNGCFREILKYQPDTHCFIMHDVDLLMIDDRNMYTCPIFPRHLSVAIDKFHFYLPYQELVGGVLAMRREHYILVNGYSTNYWGWGGEDDDMYARIIKKSLKVQRPPTSIARYTMLKHTHQKLNPARMKVLRTAHIRIDSDGVNNVKYQLLNTTFYHLFTHLLIDVGKESSKPEEIARFF